MNKWSQRAAGLTSSITAGLIFIAVALTALLAYRAFEASRAQKATVENTLRDYAGFAAFQVKNFTYGRIAGQHRLGTDAVLRWMNAPDQKGPLGAERIREIVEARRVQCKCLDGVDFYFQLTFADSRIESTASALATPENLRWLRDTIIANSRAVVRRDAAVPTPANNAPVPIPSLHFVAMFSPLGGKPYAFAHTLTTDTSGTPTLAYGYAIPAEQLVGGLVQAVLNAQPVLPATLTRGMSIDSLLAVTVSGALGEIVYESNPEVDSRYAAADSLDMRQGGLRFEVAMNPSAAGRLIIGGLPRSRLPELIATAFVAVSLLVLLLFQFRRQEELGRLRDDFVSGVSHELRTPLAQIRLLAELLHMGKVPTEEKKDRSLRIIDQEARRLSFLVDSILSFTRSQPNKLSPVRTDVAIEIDEIVSGFEPLAQAHGVQITTRLERGIVADVDRGALRQVLLNLLDNAVRYGPPRQNVTITTSSAGDMWTLEVADEGPGVPEHESERIFSPYYRMKRDAGGAVGGTGIGLAVVRRLVSEHGGRVHVVPANSSGAAGARFVVTLPLAARVT